jgi:hypothetical protein
MYIPLKVTRKLAGLCEKHMVFWKERALAVNPPNAMLNYLYAILESEARRALSDLGSILVSVFYIAKLAHGIA